MISYRGRNILRKGLSCISYCRQSDCLTYAKNSVFKPNHEFLLPKYSNFCNTLILNAKNKEKKKKSIVNLLEDKKLRIVIIGRPNVGKSTLFNKLIGMGSAIVHPTPGVTRDYQEGTVIYKDTHLSKFLHLLNDSGRGSAMPSFDFTLIDTAGEENIDKILAQTEQAVLSSHIGLFVTDRKAGITEWDIKIATYLQKRRGSGFPVLHVLNKFDQLHYLEEEKVSSILEENTIDLMGDPIPVSAEHNFGFQYLFEALKPCLMKHMIEQRTIHLLEQKHRIDGLESPKEEKENGKGEEEEEDGEDETQNILRLAIVGRPNVGKSTLINSLIGSDRLVVSDIPGTTRDAIELRCTFDKKHEIVLIDTAGLRKKKYTDKHAVEALTLADTYRNLKFANVVALLIDAKHGLTNEELEIASMVEREGRGLILVANKWDLVTETHQVAHELQEKIAHSLSQISGISMVVCSALKKTNLKLFMEKCIDCFNRWQSRIPTSSLNRFLQQYLNIHSPSFPQHGFPKIHYLTQVGRRPPTFAIFFTKAPSLPQRFERQIINAIREEFDLHGVPVRLVERPSSGWKEVEKKIKSKKKKKNES